jgi:GrpB-like predicted nucleotidyltransferase (UPF0157 family)
MEELVAFGREADFREAARHVFDAHRSAIEALLPRARIEHVGSTAVPGSVTKGDLDVCVIVEPAGFSEADARMASRYTMLRRDRALRRAYDALKRGYDGRPMDEYRAAKAAFIEEALARHPREGGDDPLDLP